MHVGTPEAVAAAEAAIQASALIFIGSAAALKRV